MPGGGEDENDVAASDTPGDKDEAGYTVADDSSDGGQLGESYESPSACPVVFLDDAADSNWEKIRMELSTFSSSFP